MATIRFVVLLSLAMLLAGVEVFAHTGGVDSYGCHKDTKADNYHCHHGEYKGREFYSRQAMLDQLEKDKQKAANAPDSIEERLRELKKLREQGLISEEDFEKKQAEILEEL